MTPIRFRRTGEEGFTILEMIVVTLLLAIMGSVLYGTINGIIRGRNAALNANSAFETARYIIGRLNRELTSRASEPLSSPDDTQPGAQLGTTTPFGGGRRMYLEGVDRKLGNTDADLLRFTSDGSAQAFIAASGNRGRVEISYRLEEDPETERSFGNDDPVYTLVREERPAGMAEQEIAEAEKVVFPLANNVVSLDFRYLKNNSWTEEWGTRNPGFPEAIEVKLVIRGETGQDEEFRTAIGLSRKLRGMSTLSIGGQS